MNPRGKQHSISSRQAFTSLLVIAACLLISACKSRPAVIAFYKAENKSALDVAQESVNGWKNSAGAEIRFIKIGDVQSSARGLEDDVVRAETLIKTPNLIGVIGHDDSRGTLLTAPVYNEAGIPHIVPTATSIRLKKSGRWTFMLAPDEIAEGAFIGAFVSDRLNARTATIFYHSDEYGMGLRDGIASALAERGVRVIDQVSFDWMHNYPRMPDRELFENIVAASLRRGVPDVVIIAGRNGEAGQIGRLIHARAPGVIFVAGDGVEAGKAFFSTAGPAAESFYMAAFWNPNMPDEESRAFVERFRQATGREPLPTDAMKYDAAMAMAQAAREAGADREAIRRYLAELGSTRPPLRGVTGEISFAPDRAPRLVMTRIGGGAAVLVDGGK